MKSGKLRHRIEVHTVQTEPNDYGTPQEMGSVFIDLRAEVIQLTAQEYVRDRGATDEVTVAFRVRNPGTITTAQRIVFAGENYNIRQIVPIENGRGLELQCVRIA